MSVDNRQKIIEAADELFYARGFEATSLADIADVVGLSRGNFYYHFRTKDAMLDAVISRRLAATRQMLAEWEQTGSEPLERIALFVDILLRNQAKIMAYGCPVGTLCNELARLDHVARGTANAILGLFREWLIRQFVDLGRADDADALALHLLMRSQGVATLANALRDEAFVAREVADMQAWVAAQAAQGQLAL